MTHDPSKYGERATCAMVLNQVSWILWPQYQKGYTDGLVQEIWNSSVLAMKLRLSCTEPSIYDIPLKFAYTALKHGHRHPCRCPWTKPLQDRCPTVNYTAECYIPCNQIWGYMIFFYLAIVHGFCSFVCLLGKIADFVSLSWLLSLIMHGENGLKFGMMILASWPPSKLIRYCHSFVVFLFFV